MAENKKENVFLLASEAFIKDFKELVSLSNEHILFLAKALNDKHGFGVPDRNTSKEIISTTRISPDKIQQIIDVSIFIFDTIVEQDLDYDKLFLNLKDIVNKHKLPDISRKKTALKNLFFVSPEFKEKQKKLPYIKGVGYNLHSVAITCEARAIYPLEESKKIEVLGYHPLTTIKIEAKNSEDESNNIVFNATMEDLTNLIDKLKTAKRQLQSLEKDLNVSKKLI